MSVPNKQMTEEQMMMFLRNALVVAGQEMGDNGDHWPVIKSTVHSVMKTWEDVKTDRNVDSEMKTHLYEQLEIMEKGLVDCTAEARIAIEPKLKQLREIYNAYFETTDDNAVMVNRDELPDYIKRAEAIVETLENENE